MVMVTTLVAERLARCLTTVVCTARRSSCCCSADISRLAKSMHSWPPVNSALAPIASPVRRICRIPSMPCQLLFRRIVDHERADAAGLWPVLPPPHASGTDRTALKLVGRLGLGQCTVKLLTHTADQSAALVLPVAALGLDALTRQPELAFGSRVEGASHLVCQRNGRSDAPDDSVRSNEADDLRVRRLPRGAGANPVVGHRRQVRLP